MDKEKQGIQDESNMSQEDIDYSRGAEDAFDMRKAMEEEDNRNK